MDSFQNDPSLWKKIASTAPNGTENPDLEEHLNQKRKQISTERFSK